MTDEIFIKCIQVCFFSATEKDDQGQSLNIVDALFAIARALDRIADTQDRELEHAKRTRREGPPEFNIEGTPLGHAFQKHLKRKGVKP